MPRIAHTLGWRAFATPSEQSDADLLATIARACQARRFTIVRRAIERGDRPARSQPPATIHAPAP